MMKAQLALLVHAREPAELWGWTNHDLFEAARRRTVPAEAFFDAADELETIDPMRRGTIIVLRQAGRRARGRAAVWHELRGWEVLERGPDACAVDGCHEAVIPCVPRCRHHWLELPLEERRAYFRRVRLERAALRTDA